jgi:Mg-chelatase subunit ChlD
MRRTSVAGGAWERGRPGYRWCDTRASRCPLPQMEGEEFARGVSDQCKLTERAIPARLLRAYRQTDYLAAGTLVRVARRVPEVFFAAVNARVAVLVTAWNPLSRRMPAGWNQRMQRRLRQCLHRFVVLDASGSLHRWHEAMLLVAGDPRPIIRLAARFRQRAVVILCRGQMARLKVVSR